MCDCYSEKCSGGCGRIIQIHIADYCVPRETVKAYCPICTQSMMKEGMIVDGKIFLDNDIIYWFKIHNSLLNQMKDNEELKIQYKIRSGSDFNENFEISSVSMLPDDKIEDMINPVMFICSDDSAYGINLN